MTFLSLNLTQMSYLSGYLSMCIFMLFLGLTLCLLTKDRKLNIGIILFFLIILLFDYTTLLELLRSTAGYHYFYPLPISFFVNEIPWPVHIIFALIAVAFVIYTLRKIHIRRKNSISNFSIKEAIENLPMGIAFLSDDVELYLSNNIMHKLSEQLTGKPLHSGAKLWEDISRLRTSVSCVIDNEEPAFILDNGEVWQFSKTTISWDESDYYQIKATDITNIYSLIESAKRANNRLSLQQNKLYELSTDVEKNTEAKLTVDMKVNFHDNFGNLLLLTKESLRESTNEDKAKDIIDLWQNLPNIITELSSSKELEQSLEQIIKLSKSLGCELIIDGALPESTEHKTTILLCINEMLKNTYRHANADKLFVVIKEYPNKTEALLYSNDNNPPSSITPGGGLIGLRERVEQLGGKMSVYCSDAVYMEITLYKTSAL